MITRNGNRYNCCESTLILINEKKSLPGFDDATMRIASNLGGGVAGWGDICGALLGGAMAIGLAQGTTGKEETKAFDEERVRERMTTQELIKMFEKKWGSVGCRELLGCHGCTPEERAKRGEELRARGESHCDEYVDWAAVETLKLLKRPQ